MNNTKFMRTYLGLFLFVFKGISLGWLSMNTKLCYAK